MPPPGGQSKGQGGGKKNKKIKNQNNNLNATQDKTNYDERIEEEESGGGLDDLNSTSVWNTQKKNEADTSGKQGRVEEPVEEKSESAFPGEWPEQSAAAEQTKDDLFGDRRSFDDETEPSEVPQAVQQDDELPPSQTEVLSTETQASGTTSGGAGGS